MDYQYKHIETYGHGKTESNTLTDDKKVTIGDHDNHFDVYECESDDEAQAIADWYIGAVYESYPAEAKMIKRDARFFYVEVPDE